MHLFLVFGKINCVFPLLKKKIKYVYMYTHASSILGQEDPIEEGNPLQCSYLQNPMDRGT